MNFFTHVGNELMQEHKGAVAFEYIIILAIMAVALYLGFSVLQKELVAKSNDVGTFIRNNGQKPMGDSTP